MNYDLPDEPLVNDGLPDVPPVTDADLPPLRQGGTRARARFLLVFLLFVFGASFLGSGVSNVIHTGEIASNGVMVNAVVLGSDGGLSSGAYASHALQVGYTTASGQQEQGTLDAPNVASSYRVGSAITVVYDPSDPSVVAMPKVDSSGPWAQVVVGIVALLGVLAILVSTLVRARKRQS